MSELGRALIEDVRGRVTKHFPGQIRATLELLGDDEVWRRPNPESNAVGNLVLHLWGSTRHFIGRGVGGSGFERDRPAEFSEQGPLPRAELLRRLDEAVSEADRILAGLDPDGLLRTTDRVGGPFTLAQLLLRISHHWAVHTGQIVYAAKAFRAGAFDDLWNKTLPR